MHDRSNEKSVVVLVHGIGSHWLLMMPLAWQFKRKQFQTRQFGYRSWFGTIEKHAIKLQQLVEQISQDPNIDTIHIVAHSLGCIVTRQLLIHCSLPKLKRIVMLSPPNHGSPAARLQSLMFPFWFSKTLRQISNRRNSFVQSLPQEPTGCEIGIIRGSYDFVVSQSSSQLKSAKEQIQCFSGHNGLLVRPKVAMQTIAFLEHGHFKQNH